MKTSWSFSKCMFNMSKNSLLPKKFIEMFGTSRVRSHFPSASTPPIFILYTVSVYLHHRHANCLCMFASILAWTWVTRGK